MFYLNCFSILVLIQLAFGKSSDEIFFEPPELKNSSTLVESLIRILKCCHQNETNMLGIAGNIPKKLVIRLANELHFSTVLVDHGPGSVEFVPVTPIIMYKIQVFIIWAPTTSKLKSIMTDLKMTRWWNCFASFYLITWPENTRSCSQSTTFLRTAWSMNILGANFLCTDDSNGITIFGFNPYLNMAPKPWTLDKTVATKENPNWSVFSLKHTEIRCLCGDLDFDKLSDLGGHPVRITVRVEELRYYQTIKSRMPHFLSGSFPYEKFNLFHLVFGKLNATVKYVIQQPQAKLGSVKNGTADGILKDVYESRSDVELIARGIGTVMNLTWTYPFLHVYIKVLTNYFGIEEQWTKLLGIFDLTTKIMFLVTFIISSIILKYLVGQSFALAVLEVTRIICNSGFLKIPNSVTSRIYIGSLLIVAVTIHGIIAGSFASVLASTKFLPNIDSLDDLATSNHEIYSNENRKELFNSPEFKDRFHGRDDSNCTKLVVENHLAACVWMDVQLTQDAVHFKLHLSKEPIAIYPLVWAVRRDWPLGKKFDKMFQQLHETHVLAISSMENRKVCSNLNVHRAYKVLALQDLKFAFILLGCGLAIATVVFYIEICLVAKKVKKNVLRLTNIRFRHARA